MKSMEIRMNGMKAKAQENLKYWVGLILLFQPKPASRMSRNSRASG